MLEWSRLVILATALKSIDPAFEADDSTVEVVLKVLDCVEVLHQATLSSDAILFASQHQPQCG
jgi:hypothetical protein